MGNGYNLKKLRVLTKSRASKTLTKED